MSKTKQTNIEKSTNILKTSKVSQWRTVDTENEFTFMNQVFKIDESVPEYKVYEKAGTIANYTNKAHMDKVLVVLDTENQIKFYNQNYSSIDNAIGVVE